MPLQPRTEVNRKLRHLSRRLALACGLILICAALISPSASAQAIYKPSIASVTGSGTLFNPSYAWDASSSTGAAVSAVKIPDEPAQSPENVQFKGFPGITAGSVLTVNAAVSIGGNSGFVGEATIWVSFDGGATYTHWLGFTASTPQTAYSLGVPGGTNLQNVIVRVYTTVPNFSSGSGHSTVYVYDINIQ